MNPVQVSDEGTDKNNECSYVHLHSANAATVHSTLNQSVDKKDKHEQDGVITFSNHPDNSLTDGNSSLHLGRTIPTENESLEIEVESQLPAETNIKEYIADTTEHATSVKEDYIGNVLQRNHRTLKRTEPALNSQSGLPRRKKSVTCVRLLRRQGPRKSQESVVCVRQFRHPGTRKRTVFVEFVRPCRHSGPKKRKVTVEFVRRYRGLLPWRRKVSLFYTRSGSPPICKWLNHYHLFSIW